MTIVRHPTRYFFSIARPDIKAAGLRDDGDRRFERQLGVVLDGLAALLG
ncbi:hypothetical protein ACWEPN_13995 [Nonomuraea wenchangensis]